MATDIRLCLSDIRVELLDELEDPEKNKILQVTMKCIPYEKHIVPTIDGRDGFGTSRPKRNTSLSSLLRHATKI